MLKRTILSFAMFLAFAPLFSQVTEQPAPAYIRTIQFKGETELSQFPIIRLGDRLQLSFDALNGNEDDFYYKITHYNFDWTPSDLSKGEYLDGFDDVCIEAYKNSFNTLQIYSNYTLNIPNRETRAIEKSGNYLISFYNESGELIFSRKFIVTENVANVGVAIKRSRNLKYIEEKQVVQFSINAPGLQFTNPNERVRTVVMQNDNLKTAITDLKPQYTLGGELIYKYDTEASFWGGNEYLAFDNKDIRSAINGVRYVDLSDIYENYLFTNSARLDLPYTYNPDINGKFVVRNLYAKDNSIEADYARMHFNLQYFEDIGTNELHLYGNFNNWTIDESTYMKYDSETGTYENARLFKQGFYNYKYVLVNRDGSIVDGAVSGNFWQTENDYTVIVYYRDLGGRFDRVLGIGRANSINITNN